MTYVLPDTILGCKFESLAVGFIRLLEEVFRPATAWSHQVITLFNSYVTLVRLHDYSIRIILVIVSIYFRLLRMGFFLSSTRLTSAAIKEEEMKKSLHFSTAGLRFLYFVQHKPSGCQHGLCVGYRTMRVYGSMGIIKLVLTVTHAPIVSRLVNLFSWKCKLYSTSLESVAYVNWSSSAVICMTETRPILRVIQFLQVQLLVGYLRWKFRLVAIGLWSTRFSCMGFFFFPSHLHGAVLSPDYSNRSQLL